MVNITVPQALQFAEEHFPYAPEKLAELLKIQIRRSPLNCDGWCLKKADKSIIRINSSVSDVRQRFTLAHEIGHLILDIPSIIGESIFEAPRFSNQEENLVNAFAGEILLPLKTAQSYIPQIPITSLVLKKVARKANVSELFVARRLAYLAPKIGLKDGLVVFYKNNKYEWQWSQTVEIKSAVTEQLLEECLRLHPKPVRFHRESQNDVIVASILDNPHLDTKTVFLQVVEEDVGLKTLDEELRRDLEHFLLCDKLSVRPSLEGCFSSMKNRVKDLFLDEAVMLFNARYLERSERWDQEFRERLKSKKGQQYIRLRLKIWAKS